MSPLDLVKRATQRKQRLTEANSLMCVSPPTAVSTPQPTSLRPLLAALPLAPIGEWLPPAELVPLIGKQAPSRGAFFCAEAVAMVCFNTVLTPRGALQRKHD